MPFFTPQTAFKAQAAILATILLLSSGLSGSIAVESQTARDLHMAAPAKKVVIPKHRAAVLLPVVDQQDILPNHRLIADNTLRALPSACRDNLKNFYVTYDPTTENRGLGGASTIIIMGVVQKSDPKKPTLIADREFRGLLVHECGHIVDLGGLKGTVAGGLTAFFDANEPIFGNDPSLGFYRISWTSAVAMKDDAKNSWFVSDYAKSDSFEDFAETFAFFVLQQKEFKRLAAKNPVLKAKYDWMQEHVFAGEPQLADGRYVRGKKAPWDVTKLAYIWLR